MMRTVSSSCSVWTTKTSPREIGPDARKRSSLTECGRTAYEPTSDPCSLPKFSGGCQTEQRGTVVVRCNPRNVLLADPEPARWAGHRELEPQKSEMVLDVRPDLEQRGPESNLEASAHLIRHRPRCIGIPNAELETCEARGPIKSHRSDGDD